MEACVFLSYIGSAILYLFIRAFHDAEHNLSTGNAISTTYSDTLEHSAVNLECFESFFAPLFATALLRTHLFDFDYHELMKEHSVCNIICEMFIYFSATQVVLACLLNFVPVWQRRGYRTRNKVCPTVHYICYILLIFAIPAAKILTFAVALLFTDIWDTIVGPWLLACCSVALFIMGVWYPTVIRQALAEAQENLKKEQEWDDARLEGKRQAKDLATSLVLGLGGVSDLASPLLEGVRTK